MPITIILDFNISAIGIFYLTAYTNNRSNEVMPIAN